MDRPEKANFLRIRSANSRLRCQMYNKTEIGILAIHARGLTPQTADLIKKDFSEIDTLRQDVGP